MISKITEEAGSLTAMTVKETISIQNCRRLRPTLTTTAYHVIAGRLHHAD
jgi:hypothetical protein